MNPSEYDKTLLQRTTVKALGFFLSLAKANVVLRSIAVSKGLEFHGGLC